MAAPVSDLGSEPRVADSTLSTGRRLVFVAAATMFLAGSLHLVLIDAQFRRWGAAGAVLLVLGLYEVLAGAGLMGRPGPRAYRAGTWGSGLIAAAYVATKVLPVPIAPIPQPVSALEIAALALDLAALLLLATVMPDTATRRPRRPAPRLAGLVVALATPIIWVFVSGALLWVDPAALPLPPATRLFWNPDRSGLITPALYGFVTDRLYPVPCVVGRNRGGDARPPRGGERLAGDAPRTGRADLLPASPNGLPGRAAGRLRRTGVLRSAARSTLRPIGRDPVRGRTCRDGGLHRVLVGEPPLADATDCLTALIQGRTLLRHTEARIL